MSKLIIKELHCDKTEDCGGEDEAYLNINIDCKLHKHQIFGHEFEIPSECRETSELGIYHLNNGHTKYIDRHYNCKDSAHIELWDEDTGFFDDDDDHIDTIKVDCNTYGYRSDTMSGDGARYHLDYIIEEDEEEKQDRLKKEAEAKARAEEEKKQVQAQVEEKIWEESGVREQGVDLIKKSETIIKDTQEHKQEISNKIDELWNSKFNSQITHNLHYISLEQYLNQARIDYKDLYSILPELNKFSHEIQSKFNFRENKWVQDSEKYIKDHIDFSVKNIKEKIEVQSQFILEIQDNYDRWKLKANDYIDKTEEINSNYNQQDDIADNLHDQQDAANSHQEL